MTNNERLLQHNAELRECIEIAESLPDAGNGTEPIIQPLEATKNGTYTAPDGVDGYSPVVINVPINDMLAARLNNTLKSYTSDEVFSIGNYAFYNCTLLESINCPSCKQIDTAPFQNCTSLKGVDFPSCTVIGGTVFRNCTALTHVNMPELKSSSTYSFAQCSSLKHISLPKIEVVSGAMFQNCSALEYAYIPNATSIGAMCFQYCSSLSTVIIEQTRRACALAAVTAFEGTLIASENGSIYVPDNRVEEYKSTTNWSAYADQIKPLSELEVTT